MGVDGVGALAGVRVVVTRPAERAGGFVARLENAGATVIKLPTIATADPDSWAPVDAAIARLASGAYLWVMFTSRIGAERFLERVARHPAGDALDSALVGAVGPGTARCLEEAGVKVSLVPKLFTAAALASEIGPAPGSAGQQGEGAPGSAGPENRSGPGSAGPQNKADHGSAGAQDKAEPGRVLLPRAAEKPPDMRAVLTGAGWSVDQVTVYRTVPAGEGPAAPAVRAGDFDVVTFTSGSAARAFVGLVGKPAELGLGPGGDDSALRS
ncbi:MAG: uroporphyrinogen-III synthase, partial [Actinobacteria bacterium]|nr:uroporphyrinogen-III synthase [Actinomycetota bacterium]